jgi:uncharacterized phage-associated protein
MNNIYRLKLLNAVLFYAQRIPRLNLTKLMKLLNFLDFEHFKRFGYPSIGLQYYAFEKGPVPRKFWAEIKDGAAPADLAEKVVLSVKSGEYGRKELEIHPRPGAQVDSSVFTAQELKILDRLAFIFQESTAGEVSDISHEAERPWHRTIEEKGLNAEIDYLLALDEGAQIPRDEAEENLRDTFAFMKALGLEP